MIITLLIILLYALFALLVLELVFWIVGLFVTVPGKVRQIVYAIVGVLFLLWIVQSFAGTALAFPHFPH
jgi:hypothetical protein